MRTTRRSYAGRIALVAAAVWASLLAFGFVLGTLAKPLPDLLGGLI